MNFILFLFITKGCWSFWLSMENHGHSREGQPPFTGNPNLSDSSFFLPSMLCSANTEHMVIHYCIRKWQVQHIQKLYHRKIFFFSSLFPSKTCPDVYYDKAKEKPARIWLQTPVTWERSLNHMPYWVATPRLERVISMPKLVSPNIIIITGSSWVISTTVKSVSTLWQNEGQPPFNTLFGSLLYIYS